MKKFSKEFNGYNKQEVTNLLNDVIRQLEKDLENIKKQQDEIRSLKLDLVHQQSLVKSLNFSLEQSQKVGDHIRFMAKEEANEIIQEAKNNASRIVNDALIRNEKIELKTMNAEKNLRILKRKLHQIVEQQLEIVEEIETLEIEE